MFNAFINCQKRTFTKCYFLFLLSLRWYVELSLSVCGVSVKRVRKSRKLQTSISPSWKTVKPSWISKCKHSLKK